MSKKRPLDISENVSTKRQKLNESKDGKNLNRIMGLEENENKNDNKAIQRNVEPIILNVGGIKYSISMDTLFSYSNSVLCKMFEGKFSIKPSKDGSYFIDRYGEHFKYILHYLQNKKLNLPQDNINYLIHHLLLDAKYYHLQSLELSLYSLLVCKLSSNILSEKDMKFVCECLEYDYPNGINMDKSSLIYRGDTYPQIKKLEGLNRLLMVFEGEDNKFAFYFEAGYSTDNVVDGCSIDFDSLISGERYLNKKHKSETGGHFHVFPKCEDDIQDLISWNIKHELDCPGLHCIKIYKILDTTVQNNKPLDVDTTAAVVSCTGDCCYHSYDITKIEIFQLAA